MSQKNETVVTLWLSSILTSNCNDDTNFPHVLLLANRKVTSFYKAFPNNSSANIKLSKSQLF